MTEPAAMVPPEIAAYADMMNAWTEGFARLAPVTVQFRVDLTTLPRRGPDGARFLERVVRSWSFEPTGPHMLHLPPAVAEEYGALLIAKAREARAALIAPNGKAHHD